MIKLVIHPFLFVHPRFIAAINRKYGPADALHTVQLASAIKAKGNGSIVGIDLSGDPKVSVL